MITNEDLLKEISEQELKELSDLNANGILNQNVIDDACNYTSYAKGRGLIASSGGCSEWQSYDNTQQVYYKKYSSTWGTSLLLTDINDLSELPEIKVYPNPNQPRKQFDDIEQLIKENTNDFGFR